MDTGQSRETDRREGRRKRQGCGTGKSPLAKGCQEGVAYLRCMFSRQTNSRESTGTASSQIFEADTDSLTHSRRNTTELEFMFIGFRVLRSLSRSTPFWGNLFFCLTSALFIPITTTSEHNNSEIFKNFFSFQWGLLFSDSSWMIIPDCFHYNSSHWTFIFHSNKVRYFIRLVLHVRFSFFSFKFSDLTLGSDISMDWLWLDGDLLMSGFSELLWMFVVCWCGF